MEEFGWVLIIAVVWVLSSIKEFREAQRKKQRREERPEERATSRQREPEHVQTGPRAGQRDLARELDAGARRAEEALRRWEARQQQTETAAPTARGSAGPARVDEQRREAYRAIAEMLEGRDPEAAEAPEDRQPEGPRLAPVSPAARRPVHRAAQIDGPSLLTKGGTLVAARRPVAALEEPPVRTIESGLDRIERLAPLQRAVVWSELLGPPIGLREDT